MSGNKAWILDFGEGIAAALGSAELVQVVSNPELFALPHTPPHCSQAMIWQGRALPVMDVGRWLVGREISRPRLFAGVCAHRLQGKADELLEFSALLLAAIPAQRIVNDDEARPLPAEPAAWQQVSWSCFGGDDRLYPVLALPRVFSGSLTQ